MATPTVVAVGTTGQNTVAGNGNPTNPGVPTGTTTDDIMVMVVAAADNVTVTLPVAWTKKIEQNNGTAQRLTIAWKRAGASETAPPVTHTAGDSASAYIISIRGVPNTVTDPFAVIGTPSLNVSSLTVATNSILPAGQTDLVFWVGISGLAGNASIANGYSVPAGTDPTFVARASSVNGGGINEIDSALFTGPTTTASATGARSSTLSVAAMPSVAVMFTINDQQRNVPSLVGQVQGSTWGNSGTTRTTAAITVAVGDALVVLGMDEGASTSPDLNIANSGVAQTWTRQQNSIVGGWSYGTAWTAIADTAQSMTVTVTLLSTARAYGMIFYVLRNHGGIGSSTEAHATPAALASTPLTTAANSFVACITADYAANAWATRNYLTNFGAAAEDNYFTLAGSYTVATWHHSSSGTAGTKNFGQSTPNYIYTNIAVEILAPAGGGAAPWSGTANTGAIEVWPKLVSAPGSPTAGQVYYNTGTNQASFWDGAAWVNMN